MLRHGSRCLAKAAMKGKEMGAVAARIAPNHFPLSTTFRDMAASERASGLQMPTMRLERDTDQCWSKRILQR